mgnify:CR=1 FL=1
MKNIKTLSQSIDKRENLLIDFDDELWLATVHQLKVCF